ncbi:MAG: VOC family protein [Anaerolineales bacterium]|jgi:predicted enzyme related to lactoylglutathione lyase|nr:VOC family protein [Anaerolineales bacterium]
MDGIFKKLEVVSYNVRDWQRAKVFYGETLGLPVAFFINDEIGWMEFGEQDGAHLAINHWEGPEPFPAGPGGATVVLAVEDAAQAVAELRRRGVKCDDPVGIPDMVTYATFYDPDGNRLQLAGPPPTIA